MKWKKAVIKIVNDCWIRSEPTKRKYRQQIKKIWDEIGVFAVTGQRLADQASQIQTNKWLADVEIEEIRTQLERNSSKVEVQENDQEKIEHNENNQSQSEEQGTQEVLVEQGQENKKQQKTYYVSSFLEDEEMLVKKAEMESYYEDEKELLIKVVKEIRYGPERIQPNLKYINRKKV